MKIYFDGCSYTEGRSYLGDDYKNLRWSKLLCDKLGAEEYNISDSGSCNQRMLRNLANDHCNKNYDLMIIQLSYPNRTEYWNGSYFQQVNNHVRKSVKKSGGDAVSLAFQMYYRNVYEEKYGLANELTVYNSIKYICEAKKLPLITLSCNPNTTLPVDHVLKGYEHASANDSHPSVNAQKLIAAHIYSLL
tara:strand:- start:512 stop:1081 length:570 start_codon:yes stop_codon:yes gene_type:complete